MLIYPNFASLRAFAAALALTVGLWAGPAQAQDREVPYWASLRFDEVNMRAGPSQDYPIEWVYRRKGMPVRVVRLREGWRLVEDSEGTQGWIERSQLSPALGAMVIGEGIAELREAPAATSPLRWRAQPGVVGLMLRCREAFCEIQVGGRSGWVKQDRLWGAPDLSAAK